MHMRCLWCALATSALAVAVSGFSGCSEGTKPAPALATVPGGDVPSPPQPSPKPEKNPPGASTGPSAPAVTPPAAEAAEAPALAPAVNKGSSVKSPPKGKIPDKLQRGKVPGPSKPL